MESLDLPARFRLLRVQAGLTQTAVAKPRYTLSYVSQIEAGRKTPSPEALAFFSSRLGVTPEFLATGVPTGIEHSLRYRLEEARRMLRARELSEAERVTRSVLDESERYGFPRVEAMARKLLGDGLMLKGQLREAIDAYEEALWGELSLREEGLTVASLGRAYRAVGDLGYAADLIESFLMKGNHGPLDPDVTSELYTALGSVYFERGDVVRAERAAQRALAGAEGSDPEIRANAYWTASRIMVEAKRWEEALELATRARTLMEQVDDRRRVAMLHNACAFIYLEANPPEAEKAARHLDLSEALLEEIGASSDLAYVFTERSRLALLEGRPADALTYAERAESVVGADQLELARCVFLRGRALGMLDRRPEAESALHEAAAMFEKLGARQQEASCWREFGYLRFAHGDLEGAVEVLFAGLDALDPRRSRA